nr:MAG TPA: hypothetical protein [Caudoviricetes sp.]
MLFDRSHFFIRLTLYHREVFKHSNSLKGVFPLLVRRGDLI